MTSIDLVKVVGLSVTTTALVASMEVSILAAMLLVAGIMAVRNGKMSRLLLFRLFPFLDLLKDAGRFIGSLALLKKGDTPTWVHGHCLACLCGLELMHLGLCKRRFVCSSLVLGAMPLFDKCSHHQGN